MKSIQTIQSGVLRKLYKKLNKKLSRPAARRSVQYAMQWLTPKTRTCPRVTKPNLVARSNSVRSVGETPEIGVHWGHAPWDGGRG